MFHSSSEFYDLIYSTIKDYPSEAKQIAGLLRRLHPQCETVLDVACGTGEHVKLLAVEGFIVDGLDLDPALLQIAKQKHSSRFFQADMSDFHLPDRYDAVLCLFSSIGYLVTLDRVATALTCFREHLAPGGVIVVEPWFEPSGLDTTRVGRNVAESDGVCVTRVSRVEVEDRVSRLYFDYEISDSAGTRKVSEIHELGLFTTVEMLEQFHKAGLEVEYDAAGLTGRGLYVARM